EDVRVISVEGPTGCGKTALVGAFVEHLTRSGQRQVVRSSLSSARSVRGLGEWVVTDLAKRLGVDGFPAAERELWPQVLTFLAQHDRLVVVDNAETLDPSWLEAFIGHWLQRDGRSQLLITTTSTLRPDSPAFQKLVLGGLSTENDSEAILSLLGSELRE